MFNRALPVHGGTVILTHLGGSTANTAWAAKWPPGAIHDQIGLYDMSIFGRADMSKKPSADRDTTCASAEQAAAAAMDAETPDTDPGTEDIESLRTQAAQAQEHWERLLRTTADFDNFRKRAARDKEEAIRYANHALLERLLPVLDSFDMAVAAAENHPADDTRPLKDGIQLVLQQFKSVLKEAGLQEIEAQGKPFDPNLHEAVSQMDTHEIEEGHVAQQLRKGYLLRDRLVRPSTVVVARKPSA